MDRSFVGGFVGTASRIYIVPEHAVACQEAICRLWEYLYTYHSPQLRDGALPDQIVAAAIERLRELHAVAWTAQPERP